MEGHWVILGKPPIIPTETGPYLHHGFTSDLTKAISSKKDLSVSPRRPIFLAPGYDPSVCEDQEHVEEIPMEVLGIETRQGTSPGSVGYRGMLKAGLFWGEKQERNIGIHMAYIWNTIMSLW